MATKFCVFCGSAPIDKNKEHVLPQWLLRLTGDPNRVVKLGTNFETLKDVAFSWSSLVVPACTACNKHFSQLEDMARPVVERLVRREPLTGNEYLCVLDWLDKVRVGLWIAYMFIQKPGTNISPKFHIESRMAAKDRLVAVYALNSEKKGLNAHGVESPLFHLWPSAFGLRINNLWILNISADYFFSSRCGFPAPRQRQLLLDGENAGMLVCADFQFTGRVRHPLLRAHIHKPSVFLFQPIAQLDFDDLLSSGALEPTPSLRSFLNEYRMPSVNSREGILFRQFTDRVQEIRDMSAPIAFDSVTDYECASMFQLLAQVYDFQNYLTEQVTATAESTVVEKNYWKGIKQLKKANVRVSNYLKSEPDA